MDELRLEDFEDVTAGPPRVEVLWDPAWPWWRRLLARLRGRRPRGPRTSAARGPVAGPRVEVLPLAAPEPRVEVLGEPAGPRVEVES